LTQPPAKGARRITTLALLTAIALTIFMAEAQMAPVFAIPGIKLGLANIVLLYAIYLMDWKSGVLLMAAKAVLSDSSKSPFRKIWIMTSFLTISLKSTPTTVT